MERRAVTWIHASLADARAWGERSMGVLAVARSALAPPAYEALLDELVALIAEVNEADDGSVRFDAEYLRVLARRRD